MSEASPSTRNFFRPGATCARQVRFWFSSLLCSALLCWAVHSRVPGGVPGRAVGTRQASSPKCAVSSHQKTIFGGPKATTKFIWLYYRHWLLQLDQACCSRARPRGGKSFVNSYNACVASYSKLKVLELLSFGMTVSLQQFRCELFREGVSRRVFLHSNYLGHRGIQTIGAPHETAWQASGTARTRGKFSYGRAGRF